MIQEVFFCSIFKLQTMIIEKANRLNKVDEYYFSTKLKQIKALNEGGKNILNIGIGNPDLPPHANVLNKLCEVATSPQVHGYQSYRGTDELRCSINNYYQKHYNIPLLDSEILPLIGSKEGIMHITQAFINEGDTVLIPNPGYPTYKSVSKLAGAKVLEYKLSEKNNYQIDLEALKQLPLDEVKLIWVNYPNMPTGADADLENLKQLINLAKKHSFLIINDNPYSRILTKKVFSIFQIDGAKEVALELNSLSKSHNMAGWRIGWLCGDEKYVDTVLNIRSNVDSGMFYALQKAATEALNLDYTWFKQQDKVYSRRKELVHDLFSLLNCTYNKNQVGLFVWAKIPDSVDSVDDLVDDLILSAEVFITPGKIFGSEGERYLRASLCTKEETLKKVIQRIKKHIIKL